MYVFMYVCNATTMTMTTTMTTMTTVTSTTNTVATRSHPEMVGDILRETLNSDLSKIPFVCF